MENLNKKRLSNFAKIVFLLLIALFVGCIAFNIKAINEGSLLLHEEIINNTYITNNGKTEIYIKSDNSLRIYNIKNNTYEMFDYVYDEGIIIVVLPDEEKYEFIFLNNNRLYFKQKNLILYLTD